MQKKKQETKGTKCFIFFNHRFTLFFFLLLLFYFTSKKTPTDPKWYAIESLSRLRQLSLRTLTTAPANLSKLTNLEVLEVSRVLGEAPVSLLFLLSLPCFPFSHLFSFLSPVLLSTPVVQVRFSLPLFRSFLSLALPFLPVSFSSIPSSLLLFLLRFISFPFLPSAACSLRALLFRSLHVLPSRSPIPLLSSPYMSFPFPGISLSLPFLLSPFVRRRLLLRFLPPLNFLSLVSPFLHALQIHGWISFSGSFGISVLRPLASLYHLRSLSFEPANSVLPRDIADLVALPK